MHAEAISAYLPSLPAGGCADMGGPDQQCGQVAVTPLCIRLAWAAVHHRTQGQCRDAADQKLLDGIQGGAATALGKRSCHLAPIMFAVQLKLIKHPFMQQIHVDRSLSVIDVFTCMPS